MKLTAPVSRAARGLLDWSQADLAREAGVGVSTIADFERGKRTPIGNNLAAIQSALEAAGIEFLNHGQPGVQLRKGHEHLSAAEALDQQKAASGSGLQPDRLAAHHRRKAEGE